MCIFVHVVELYIQEMYYYRWNKRKIQNKFKLCFSSLSSQPLGSRQVNGGRVYKWMGYYSHEIMKDYLIKTKKCSDFFFKNHSFLNLWIFLQNQNLSCYLVMVILILRNRKSIGDLRNQNCYKIKKSMFYDGMCISILHSLLTTIHHFS